MKNWSADLPYITSKQQEVMMFIYKFRFLDRIQVQTLLEHKDYKRINAWLRDLVSKGYLVRIYERKIPLNIQPAVYFAAPTGVRLLKRKGNSDIVHKLYREKYRSDKFRNHCLSLANLYIELLQRTKDLNALNYFHTKVDLSEVEDMIEPYPDALFSLNRAPSEIIKKEKTQESLGETFEEGQRSRFKSRKERRYFLELMEQGVPRYYLRYRVRQYLKYSDSDTDQQPGTNPVALFICANDQTRLFLTKFIKKALEKTFFKTHFTFALTTLDQLLASGIFGEIWTPINLRELKS
ncbi:MAG: replication-relaxation family protein [Candidatus Woykebacteria bacterium]